MSKTIEEEDIVYLQVTLQSQKLPVSFDELEIRFLLFLKLPTDRPFPWLDRLDNRQTAEQDFLVSKMNKRDTKFPDNGFEAWGGYMQAKISKLEDQYTCNALKNQSKLSAIFEGICIFVNGYTIPSANELKVLMCQHGGVYHTYHRHDDYIIASNLPDTKVKKMDLSRVVKPEWITESIAANCLLNYKKYLLYNTSQSQPKLFFNNNTVYNLTLNNNSEFKNKTDILWDREHNLKLSPDLKNAKVENKLLVKNVSDFKQTKTAADPNFISEFYNNSRLHHISQLSATFKQYVNELRTTSKFEFPSREKFKNNLTTANKEKVNIGFDGNKTIMHIDMDCFFVSVGLRSHPELYGKPVAVTHSKKGQPRTKRPGVDRNVEFELYKQKQAKKLTNEYNLSSIYETRVDNITDENDKFGSMSEIASCSYEARAKGVTNGMFMGNALRLCPDLLTIPYDFDAYKVVAYTLYNTVAQYTLDIEAVSCDEMYVDCTELLKSTDMSVDVFALALREEIKQKTGCPCSTGFGGNRLQARLATKRAKPDGQFFLSSDLVKDYIFEIKLKDLPGVGRNIAQKLENLGHVTCGTLQDVPLNILKQHLGNKTGVLLFEQCRGIDSNPLTYYNIRKSVSAEVNYGIRFENDDQCFEFIRQLAYEVNSRMLQFKVTGKCITLKLMVRAAEAPVETAKFMGHGFCNVINKSVTLCKPTNESDIIFQEVISLVKKLNVNPKEMRGVGIQVTKLEFNSLKEPKGALSRFLSTKPINDTTQYSEIDKIMESDVLQTSRSSPKKHVFSPDKPKSPANKNKSPTQKRRGRPPKSPRIPVGSQNFLSKFIQSHSFSYFREEIIEQATRFSFNSADALMDIGKIEKTEESERGKFQDLDWDKVRELLRAWLDSHHLPLACDVELIASYMRGMVFARRIEDLKVLMNFLIRKTSEMSPKTWTEACEEIVKQVQNAMVEIYGKNLFLATYAFRDITF